MRFTLKPSFSRALRVSATEGCSTADATIVRLRLPYAFAAPKIRVLFASVAPEVNTICSGCAPIAPAMVFRASVTRSSASSPILCREEGLP